MEVLECKPSLFSVTVQNVYTDYPTQPLPCDFCIESEHCENKWAVTDSVLPGMDRLSLWNSTGEMNTIPPRLRLLWRVEASSFVTSHLFRSPVAFSVEPNHRASLFNWSEREVMWGSGRNINLMSVFTSGWCQQPTNHRPRHSSALERHRECVEWGFGGLPIMMKNHCRTNLFPCPS